MDRPAQVALGIAALMFFGRTPALALGPPQAFAGYLRSRWVLEDGLPHNIVNSLAQSADGFLWMTAGSGYLLRFDGVRFHQAPSPQAGILTVAADGDLWMSKARTGGILHIAADRLQTWGPLPADLYHPGPDLGGNVRCLHPGRNGTLWVGTVSGLFHFERGTLSLVIPGLSVGSIQESSDGHLHLIATGGYVEWDGSSVLPHPEIARELGVKPTEIFQVLQDRHGVTWYGTALGVARRNGDKLERLQPYGPGHGAVLAYEDSLGTVWFGRSDGVYRSTPDGLELTDATVNARCMYGDRDGNLWIGTNGDGLIRLMKNPARVFTQADGLPGKAIMTVLSTQDGTIWAGANCGGVSRFDGQRFHTYAEKDGLLNSCVFALAEDAAHDLWIGTYGGGAFRLRDGTFTQFSKGQGLQNDAVTSVLPARDGSIWFATPTGVGRLVDGLIRNYPTATGQPHKIFNLTEDRNGGVWAGTAVGIERFDGQRFVMATAFPNGAWLAREIDPDRRYVVEAKDYGIFRLTPDRPVSVFPDSGAFGNVQDKNGDLWFCGVGLRRLPPDSVLHPRGPDDPIDYTTFGYADGLVSKNCAFAFPNSAVDHEGKVWLAGLAGLQRLDVTALAKTNRQPAVYVDEVTIGKKRQEPGKELILAPGTEHVELRFAAVEITSPEKIRMQYRMEGVDSEWLDATPPALATYSGVRAGTHAFRMRVCNREGTWDLNGTAYKVVQLPYFYETNLFRGALVGLVVLLLAGAYRFRMRQVAAGLNARFDERLAERTRLAREFHDTLLQTIQGGKLVADDALRHKSDTVKMEGAMEKLSEWLGQAIEEGRAALSSLRTSTIEGNELAEAFKRACEECTFERPIEFAVSVKGSSRTMHPIVRDEIYRIGYEAIRNACLHSEASRIDVELDYQNDLVLQVRDNGKGMEPTVARSGKEGHFGLIGMYERAARIRGKLSITTSAKAGTLVELAIPRSVAFPM